MCRPSLSRTGSTNHESQSRRLCGRPGTPPILSLRHHVKGRHILRDRQQRVPHVRLNPRATSLRHRSQHPTRRQSTLDGPPLHGVRLSSPSVHLPIAPHGSRSSRPTIQRLRPVTTVDAPAFAVGNRTTDAHGRSSKPGFHLALPRRHGHATTIGHPPSRGGRRNRTPPKRDTILAARTIPRTILGSSHSGTSLRRGTHEGPPRHIAGPQRHPVHTSSPLR
jgi:hypothetical protein